MSVNIRKYSSASLNSNILIEGRIRDNNKSPARYSIARSFDLLDQSIVYFERTDQSTAEHNVSAVHSRMRADKHAVEFQMANYTYWQTGHLYTCMPTFKRLHHCLPKYLRNRKMISENEDKL